MSTPTLIDRARALLTLAPNVYPRPWRWWTSNSTIRLSSEPTSKDGDVLDALPHPFTHAPHVSCGQWNRDWIEGASNAAESLAAFADDFAKALPGLYREHFACAVLVGPVVYPAHCNCGARAHNARLDVLADKLGIPVEERRR